MTARDDRLDLLAESLHTGWRKGTDATYASTIHKLIADMDPSDWRAYVSWVDWCLSEVGYKPFAGEDALKGLTDLERNALRAVYRMQADAAMRPRPGESGLRLIPLHDLARVLQRPTVGTSKTMGGLIRKGLAARSGNTRTASYRLTPEGAELAGRSPST